jgi:hypothetical protein
MPSSLPGRTILTTIRPQGMPACCHWTLAAAMLAGACPVHAQETQPAHPRIELSYLVGVSQPSVIVEETGPRHPADAVDTGDHYVAITNDVTGRVWWASRLSIIGGFGWSSTPTRTYTFPYSPRLFPYSEYEVQRTASYHNRVFSIAQAVDLARGPVVPFVAGGIEFRAVTRTQESVSLSYADQTPSTSTSERSASQLSVFALGGIRIPVAKRWTLSTDLFLFLPEQECCVEPDGGFTLENRQFAGSLFGRIPYRWRAGAGVRF